MNLKVVVCTSKWLWKESIMLLLLGASWQWLIEPVLGETVKSVVYLVSHPSPSQGAFLSPWPRFQVSFPDHLSSSGICSPQRGLAQHLAWELFAVSLSHFPLFIPFMAFSIIGKHVSFQTCAHLPLSSIGCRPLKGRDCVQTFTPNQWGCTPAPSCRVFV